MKILPLTEKDFQTAIFQMHVRPSSLDKPTNQDPVPHDPHLKIYGTTRDLKFLNPMLQSSRMGRLAAQVALLHQDPALKPLLELQLLKGQYREALQI
jgi:hypothetical protein